MIQTPSRRGVSQNLAQDRVRYVERLGSRENSISKYTGSSSRGVLMSRLGPTHSTSQQTVAKSMRKQRPRQTEPEIIEAPAKVLAAPIPVKSMSWVLLVLGVLGSLHVLIMLGIEFNRTLEMRQGIERLSTDVNALGSEVTELKAVIEHSGDQNYLEQLARQQGFAFPDETRFITLPSEGQP